jgi:hypothetical protein
MLTTLSSLAFWQMIHLITSKDMSLDDVNNVTDSIIENRFSILRYSETVGQAMALHTKGNIILLLHAVNHNHRVWGGSLCT